MGKKIKAWTDCWVDPGIRLKDFMTRPINSIENATLTAITLSDRGWNC